MQTFEGVRMLYSYLPAAIFRIPTSCGDVYLRVSRTDAMNDRRAVVEVDREKFFALWWADRSGLHSGQAFGDKASWHADPKFLEAARGLSRGIDNPVPLVEVNFGHYASKSPAPSSTWQILRNLLRQPARGTPYVSFTNGVTRTIWLAAYDAPYFPVECRVKEAPKLHKLAGVRGSRWRTVDQLIPKN